MAPRRSGEAASGAAHDEVAAAEDERRAAALALVAQDHRRLASRCAAIVSAIEGGGDALTVRECIVGLIEAAREHFVGEEWAMRTVGWPEYPAHKAEHARLLRDACDMLKNFDVAFTTADWPALATYFRHWLASHHSRCDDPLLASLSECKERPSAAA
ncbi:MAG: hemerythrin domain-containing protein [Rhodospirillales bacterium]|nr:hemerythrin domain-containing protein [Rhodospirillales bacterium]